MESSVLYLTQKDLNREGKNKLFHEISLNDMIGSVKPAQIADIVIYANGGFISVLKNRHGQTLVEKVL